MNKDNVTIHTFKLRNKTIYVRVHNYGYYSPLEMENVVYFIKCGQYERYGQTVRKVHKRLDEYVEDDVENIELHDALFANEYTMDFYVLYHCKNQYILDMIEQSKIYILVTTHIEKYGGQQKEYLRNLFDCNYSIQDCRNAFNDDSIKYVGNKKIDKPKALCEWFKNGRPNFNEYLLTEDTIKAY